MRKLLAKSEGQRKRFKARFVKFGKKTNFKGYSESTILLTEVVDVETNMIVTDHIWFSYTKGFQNLNLAEGMIVAFDARVKEYKKGYMNKLYAINQQKKDYKLSHPTSITIVKA